MTRKADPTDVIAKIAATILIILIIAVVLGIRLWITGGDWGCVFSQDPALCVAVKGRHG